MYQEKRIRGLMLGQKWQQPHGKTWAVGYVEHLLEPTVNIDNEEVSPVMSEPIWMDPIWDYLVEATLSNDPKEASKLRARSTRFTIHQGTLYK